MPREHHPPVRPSPQPLAVRCALALCLVILCLLAACGQAEKMRQGALDYALAATLDLERERQAAALAGPGGMSFAEACARASALDPKVIAQLASLEKGRSDLEGAGSQILPRLDINFRWEVAASGAQVDRDREFTGGLVFRYDFVAALFSGEEKALRRAQVAKALHETRLHIGRVAIQLHLLACEIEYQRESLTGLEGVLALAEKAEEVERAGAQPGPEGLSSLWRWEAEAHAAQAQRRQALWKLAALRRDLAHLLGLGGLSGPAWRGESGLTGGDGPPAGPADLPGLWRQRGEARLAELDLFMAELGVEAAKRGRWPMPYASLQVGNVPIEGTNQTASSLVGLGLTFPLVDWGDGSRRVARAETDLATAKRLIGSLAQRLWKEREDGLAGLELARQTQAECARYLEKLRRRAELARQMAAQGAPLGAGGYQIEIELLRVGMECQRLELETRRAWAAWVLASGGEPMTGLVAQVLEGLLGRGKTEETPEPAPPAGGG